MAGYDLLKPLLFRLPPETAHKLAVTALKITQASPVETVLRRRLTLTDDRLQQSVFGLDFQNPVGVAAGFDKNARAPRALGALGFGHVEIGAVTALPQTGNEKPRLFRLPADRALINRFGFNNDGADAIAHRLADGPSPRIPIGVNIGKSKATPLADAPADYTYTYRQLAEFGSYFVVNISSPNTPGLRSLQQRDQLVAILAELQAADAAPLLVKLSPDLSRSATETVLEVIADQDLDGIIAVNTTTDRPAALSHPNRHENGGLSGAPLTKRATERIRFVAARTDVPIIGAGGVDSATAAYRKLRAGADLVQLYTGLVYRGPTLAREINEGLLELLERDGFSSVTEAVGADLD